MAAYNGANTVLSGPGADLEQAVARLSADGVRCDWLDTSHAFHSALLDPALDAFEAYADGFEFRSPQKILICNRTGAALGRTVHLRRLPTGVATAPAGRIRQGVATLAQLGCARCWWKSAPAGAHRRGAAPWPDAAALKGPRLPLRKNVADHRQITEAVAGTFIAGHVPDFGAPCTARRARSTCRPTPSSIGSTGSTTASRSGRSKLLEHRPSITDIRYENPLAAIVIGVWRPPPPRTRSGSSSATTKPSPGSWAMR